MENRLIESGHNCYTNINFKFSQAFSPNIFNPPKFKNTTIDDVTISNKLTSPSN